MGYLKPAWLRRYDFTLLVFLTKRFTIVVSKFN